MDFLITARPIMQTWEVGLVECEELDDECFPSWVDVRSIDLFLANDENNGVIVEKFNICTCKVSWRLMKIPKEKQLWGKSLWWLGSSLWTTATQSNMCKVSWKGEKLGNKRENRF